MKKSFILIVIGIALYSFSLFNGFVWDDELYLQKTPLTSGDGQVLTMSLFFRPAILVVHSALFIVFRYNPFFYHLFQVVFHIATAIVLFYLFKHFFKEKIALSLSLLFLVHPANVEAVCFASALQEVLFTFAGVTGIYLLVRLKTTSIITILFSITLSLIALLLKETGIMFFAIILCYLLLYQRKNTQEILLSVAFMIIALFTYGIARFGSGNVYLRSEGLFPIMRVPLAIRLINIPMIILYYLGMFFFPFNLGIAQHWVIRSPGLTTFFLPLVFEIVLFSVAVIYILKTKNKLFTFFFLWFLLGLFPHLQIVPLSMTVAERWMYFPMIGLLGMGGVVVQSLKLKAQNSKLTIILIGILIIFFTRSFMRTLDWRSGLSLFSSSISPTSSSDVQNNFGVILARMGKNAQAKKYFLASTRLAPYWWVNWNNLGSVYVYEKNYVKAEECYEKAIQNEEYQPAYENLATILVLHEKDEQKIQRFLEKALQHFPESEKLQKLQKNR